VATGPTSHNYFSQRLKLHYVDWGNERAPPLLLIHGGRDHCRNWDWVAERLRDRYHIIAPDLRGHGDSAHAIGASYGELNYVYDIAQLVHQRTQEPLTIIGHSLGGSISLLYTGLFPDTVKKLVAIEGMGGSAQQMEAQNQKPVEERLREWIKTRREAAGRTPRRYTTLEAAIARMQEENKHLSPEQARHLTVHGAAQNEDGTYSWKFDNFMRFGIGVGNIPRPDQFRIWSCISCPVLLVRGADSWAADPIADGRASHIKDARLATIEDAGHWVHHDQLDAFLGEVNAFLAE
jgi:pimeloyl-ACP methyl ester carboxylesterase